MSSAVAAPPRRFLGERAGFSVGPHPVHPRLYHLTVRDGALDAFLRAVGDLDVQRLEYVPYMRFIVARQLDEALGGDFRATIDAILRDRASGGFTIGLQGRTANSADFVKFATAVSHGVGPSNFDAMSGTFYARFVVQHTDASDSYLRQAYRALTLHTDGTYVDERTDWLLMMKFAERNARGGESRYLHLDDWVDIGRFSEHPLASYPFTYTSPPSKNVRLVLRHPTFFFVDGAPCMSYIDQFVYPETIDQAAYLDAMTESMEADPATTNVPLPIGDLVMLNNTFWVHGRAAFETDPALHRELLRQRGYFS